MEILLTNDDGVDSHGLRALAVAFQQAGHVVWVVAPDGNRSATSHAITLFSPLVIHRRTVPGLEHQGYAVSGTPSDCGKLAIRELLRERPLSLVVSGINLGANLGANVFYSGTIGGAFEGVLAGIPSVAVSVEGQYSMDDAAGHGGRESTRLAHLDDVAAYSVRLIEQLLASPGAPAEHEGRVVMYNLNLPARPVDEFRGIRVVPQGRAQFIDDYEKRSDPRERTYYWLSGIQGYTYPDGADPSADDDLQAVRDGYVALTPLVFDLTCRAEIDRLLALELDGVLAAAPDGDPG